MGCLRNLGCLVVLLIAVAIGWLYRDELVSLGGRWLPGREREEVTTTEVSAPTREWEPLTASAAQRTRTAMGRLTRRSGPVFVNIPAADAASYILEELSARLPASAESLATRVAGDRLYVRAQVRVADLGQTGALGPLAKLLGERETLEFGGTVDMVRPGLAEYRVRAIKIGDLSVPSLAIPRIVRQIRPDSLAEGLAADGLPVELPPHIGDVRIAGGKVTLYKAVP